MQVRVSHCLTGSQLPGWGYKAICGWLLSVLNLRHMGEATR